VSSRKKIERDELGIFLPKGGRRRDDHGRFVSKVVSRRDELGRFVSKKPAPSQKALPAKKPAKKLAPSKKALPAKKSAPSKRELPVKKPALSKKALPVKKPAPSKALPAKKSAPSKRELPVKKPALSKKALPAKKSAPSKRELPVKKPALSKKALPVKKPAPSKALPAKKPARRGKVPPTKKKPKRRRIRRPERPLVAQSSKAAEVEMQGRLLALLDSIGAIQGGLDMAIQTFTNRDGTVDGELRVANLPGEWRSLRGVPLLVSTLSNALRSVSVFDGKPPMGGSYWASFGIRFGPQNEAEIGEMIELYKRHRGMFQIGTYPTPAWGRGALQVALTGDKVGLRAMVESLLKKRGLPPTVILIRFIWTPDKKRPGHYRGEK
jgi:hypothetical protein